METEEEEFYNIWLEQYGYHLTQIYNILMFPISNDKIYFICIIVIILIGYYFVIDYKIQLVDVF